MNGAEYSADLHNSILVKLENPPPMAVVMS
jgi:hypothetical protein